MFYTYYCLGLADQSTDWKVLRGNYAAAYAIGSLDRLAAAVRLPRCRKEVEDAIAALSDPNYVTMTQQWQERCDRLQAERDEYHSQLDTLRSQVDELRKEAEDILAARCRRAAAILERTDSPTVVDGNAFMRVQKDYNEAFGADNYGLLRQHIDAHTRQGDGSLEADLATLILYTTMKYHLANKAK